MKIEKISDTQIKVTLNHSDLMDRDLKLSELAYGSQKAQALFKDMMAKANEEFALKRKKLLFSKTVLSRLRNTVTKKFQRQESFTTLRATILCLV